MIRTLKCCLRWKGESVRRSPFALVCERGGRECGDIRVKSLLILLLLACAVAGRPAMQSIAADAKPNIVVIMADDKY